MNRLLPLALIFLALFSSTLAQADTPVGPMNYQGRLLDNAGIPVTGSYNFSASVYNAISGGTLKYRELHNAVPVDDGVYSFLIGTKSKDAGDSTWSVELWNCCANLYLEIAVNGETLSPRHQLAAAPYAFQANLALTTNNALALGGKPSSWFDSTMEAICVSGKGKWLELANGGAGACLGIGTSFPGPTLVNWNTLTASSDFKNLDLTRANISGINFNGANLTGTIFTETTYAVQGISGANLTSTQWDAAISTDVSAFSVASNTNLSKATMKNMDMSKWSLSLITSQSYINMYSAAFLTSCPAATIGYYIGTRVWECRLMRPAGSNYFMVGPYANFSTTSAAAISSNGGMILDLDVDAFDGAGTSNASFVGVTLMQDFTSAWVYYADFSYAKLANITFAPTNAIGSKFPYSEWDNVVYPNGATFSSIDFSYAKLSNVRFLASLPYANFSFTTLRNVDFDGADALSSVNFNDAVLENVQIKSLRDGSSGTTFNRTKIYGNFHVASVQASTAPNMVFDSIHFSGATVSGALTDINFSGTLTFTNTLFRNLDLCSTTFPLVDTSAPHNDLASVKWIGPVECPDGSDVTGGTGSNTCDYSTRMTATAVGNCTAGIP